MRRLEQARRWLGRLNFCFDMPSCGLKFVFTRVFASVLRAQAPGFQNLMDFDDICHWGIAKFV